MTRGEAGAAFAGFLIGVLITCVFAVIVFSVNSQRWRQEAVDVGAAEYILDGNQAVWRWKEQDDEFPNQQD